VASKTVLNGRETKVIYRVIVPDVGATGGDVTLSKWLVKPNDFVKAGSPILVVTTDKADMEIEAFCDGYIREILLPEGNSVKLGVGVAMMADTLEEPLSPPAPHEVARVVQTSSQFMSTIGPPGRELPQEPPICPSAAEPALPTDEAAQSRRILDNTPGRVQASPLARQVARELGIELASLQGSGEGGLIHRHDVLSAASRQKRLGLQTASPVSSQRVVRRTPLSRMRKAIAERTQCSKSEVPHFYVTAVIDMTDALAFLEQAATLAEENHWVKPTLTDLGLRAAALALRHTPELNSSLQREEIVYFEDVNIGVVVALEEGMIIPVVRHADRKDLYTLAATMRQLREKATGGALRTSELTGSTLTLTNLGMFGVESFLAVINPPEAAILALGAARKRPVVWKAQIVPRVEMTVALSADHRLVDGVVAARFLNEFKDLLENPQRLTAEARKDNPT